MKKDRIVIGKIFAAHGIKGEVKVFPLTDDVKRFKRLKRCFIKDEVYDVLSSKDNKKHIILNLKGIDDRNEAELLKNMFIEVNRKDSVELKEGEYFIEDLKGLEVLDENNNKIGVMKDVLTNAAVDIYVIDMNGKEAMIAAIKENILKINEDEFIMINSKNLV